MILLCGDTHGTLNIGKLQRFFHGREDDFSKDDYLIILGDVAICGFEASESKKTREFLANLPVTVLFCDGNHENFDELNSYDTEEWNGGFVHFITDDIIHLMRGQIYEIEGKKFFVFGGAYSVDRDYRIEGLTWFKEELPTKEEYALAWENLEENGMEVDYIITHTGPYEVVTSLGFESEEGALKQTREFQSFADEVSFKHWFFGHFHVDEDVDEVFHCLYDEVIDLSDYN